MSPMPTEPALPPALRGYVAAFVLRRRLVVLLRGIGAAVAVALTWALMACLIDRAAQLSIAARWTMLVTGAMLAGAVLARHALRAVRPADWRDSAAQIERRTALFGQSLQTVTSQLLAPEDHRGSSAMLRHALSGADALAAQQRSRGARKLLPWRLAGGPWLAAAALLLCFAALWPASALELPRLVARLVYPGGNIEPVVLTRLAVSPAGAEVSPGESLTITATATGAEAAASAAAHGVDLMLSTDGRTWSRATMSPLSLADADSRFEFPLPAIDRDLRYYVRSGGGDGGEARSPTYQIRVKRIPSAAEFRIRYTFPAYTGRPTVTVTNTDGSIEAVAGTEAEVTAVSTEPLSAAEFWVGYERIPMMPTTRPTEWQAKVTVQGSAGCALVLTSTAEVRGHGPSPMLMRALPDREPSVVIQQPSTDLRLSPTDSVTLHYLAADDYGLSALAAEVRLNAKHIVTLPVTLPPRPLRREGEFTLDLSDLDAKVGDVVELLLRAEDSAEHRKEAEPRRVLISPTSVNLRAYARPAELARAHRLATAWTESLAKARDALAAARAADPRKTKQDAWPAANRALATAGETAASLRQALLRAIVRSESPVFSDAIANLADATVAPTIDPGRTLTAVARTDNALPDRLNVLLKRSTLMQEHIKSLRQGELATLAATEAANVKAIATAPRPPSQAVAELRRRAVEAANQRITNVLKELRLTSTPELPGQLQEWIDAEAKIVSQQTRPDLAAALREWEDRLHQPGGTGAELPARLAVAAQAEALRGDGGGDLVLARDLQLASRAAAAVAQATAAARDADRGRAKADGRAKLFEPLTRFGDVLRRLLQDRPHADRARVELLAFIAEGSATESSEDLALAAGAAWAGRNYDAAAKFDARLADEVARSSQDESSRFVEDLPRLRRDAGTIDSLIARTEAVRKRLTAKPEQEALVQAIAEQQEIAAALDALARGGGDATAGGSANQAMLEVREGSPEPARGPAPTDESTHRHPIAAAAWWGHAAAASLGRSDLAAAASFEEKSLHAMQIGWERIARRAEHRRLEQVPTLSALFQPYAADEGIFASTWPRFGTRFHEGFRAGADATTAASQHQNGGNGGASTSGEPPGYQDQLKAYFDAVTKVQQGVRQ
jgi:hypothetical protein